MAAFSEDPPKYAALHWDGKMLRDAPWEVILGPRPETLAFACLRTTCISEGKLLGVPVIDSSTGTAQAEAPFGFAGGMGFYWSDHCPCV
ncbi:hypothetical protein GWK47_024747 [Chionoecetes opilio]|uniref:Uncharacterized protein n=1 Tax=Chionoecetes opilio TaxID=41210 RepID=A0A8J4XN79_CHIOP|nr:hypothetical protein GWK47_024747 [Chionoecetes opilio]